MHEQARRFTLWAKEVLPAAFDSVRVLDAGGGDINGNNRFLFTNSIYHANDVVAAPNATIVSKTKDLDIADGSLDTVNRTECFEHDMEWVASITKIIALLKVGGTFVFSCASTGRPEHGTRRTTPHDSYSASLPEWSDYYKNLTAYDVRSIPGFAETFPNCQFYYNAESRDLYFLGIKQTELQTPDYQATATSRC